MAEHQRWRTPSLGSGWTTARTSQYWTSLATAARWRASGNMGVFWLIVRSVTLSGISSLHAMLLVGSVTSTNTILSIKFCDYYSLRWFSWGLIMHWKLAWLHAMMLNHAPALTTNVLLLDLCLYSYIWRWIMMSCAHWFLKIVTTSSQRDSSRGHHRKFVDLPWCLIMMLCDNIILVR